MYIIKIQEQPDQTVAPEEVKRFNRSRLQVWGGYFFLFKKESAAKTAITKLAKNELNRRRSSNVM